MVSMVLHEFEYSPSPLKIDATCQTNWIKEEKIKYRETVSEGLESAPQALRDVLTGKNFGKQVVKVAEE